MCKEKDTCLHCEYYPNRVAAKKIKELDAEVKELKDIINEIGKEDSQVIKEYLEKKGNLI